MAEVKALACELPAEHGVPLSRWSGAELAREAIKRGIVAPIAAVTIWRWQLVEHEYERKGALCYLAAWNARRARLFDRCAPKDGIEPDALVEQFMTQEPYSQAQRVFVIVDNGSAHAANARSTASNAPGRT